MSTEQGFHIPEWTLADRLKKAREDADLKQAELALMLGVSRATVSNGETGANRPMPIVLRGWAEATGVPLGWLLTGEVPRVPGGGQSVNLVNFSDTELMQYRSSSRAALRLAA